ncbi:hypothetical protein E4631_18625 [Hymenobacter sp. UV11]|uniref:hypothetical protein n=1 Tax=Hymenobacter sp. UV11 TaxID=1849735 RepID=UPI00105E93DF|nr:hypothetical protein [Hymenobacter sp. UV11]TDN36433.1 hypothetical protein A8B98_08725 [Hymenobacter sp. UV11]TFZ64533.1 hypothetical protein E4631_18625 [Hymenobacter sp. UV11]
MAAIFYFRLTFCALVAALLGVTNAQAQSTSSPTRFDAAGNLLLASNAQGENAGVGRPMLYIPPTRVSAAPDPEDIAYFYDDSRKDLSQALAWMVESNAVAPTYWNLYLESRIRLKMKDYPGAKEAAEKSYKLAIKSMPTSQPYVELSAAVVAKAHTLAKQ